MNIQNPIQDGVATYITTTVFIEDKVKSIASNRPIELQDPPPESHTSHNHFQNNQIVVYLILCSVKRTRLLTIGSYFTNLNFSGVLVTLRRVV
mmetsp:Transcript_11354/g.22037  ORF Transcript_11354/g.22037 Transcript_11354/m.22037 type:complete len:93 (+) Transcript_11354:220-498(+)